MSLNSTFLKMIILFILLFDPTIGSLRPVPTRPSTVPAPPPPPATPSPSTTCNVFPQIFGANSGDTFLNQIDVIGDYLALAGDTNDKELTGETSIIPYVAVMSVSKSGFFYWAKAFTAEQCFTIAGVQFSSDGSLLIAHTYSISGFIAVFNAATGVLLSSRGYQIGGFQNYNSRVRSMVISGGTSPKAFILTNYKTSLSCNGQNFVRFNPLSFSTQAVWAKKTAISVGGNNCGHLGLVFGRGESFLFALSWFENKSTVSLLDIDGNSIWQQATQSGDPTLNNYISYQAIDLSSDMIVATSGLDYINYNRILSTSSPPYSIQTGSQAYRDPNPSKTRQIRALYIKDQNIVNSLIFDTVNRWTDLATIDFSISKITYQRTLPLMPDGMTNGVFVSPTVYYAGSNGYNFYKDQSSSTYQYLNTNYWYQSLVYSSVTAPSSCYQLSTSAAQAPITMEVLNLFPIKDPIYQATSFSFKVYSASSTIIDITVSKNTKIAWCLQSPLTVSPVTQTFPVNDLNFIAGLGQIIPIDQYSATVNCDAGFTNTFTYSGINFQTGLPLNYPFDFISIDPANGDITVDGTKPEGTYLIKVVGTLPDFKTTAFYVFTINIGTPNIPPYFQTIIQDKEAPLKRKTTLVFPPVIDIEANGYNISIYYFPSFMQLSNDFSQLDILPIDMSYLGTYTIIAEILDADGAFSEYSFSITVTNQAPIVSSLIPNQVNITFGQNLMYNLPSSSDPESLPYTTSIKYGPQYAQIISKTHIQFYPIDCYYDFGYQEVFIKLEDEEPRNFVYSFTIFVDNNPPIFGNSLPQNQTMALNTILSYKLPYFYDPEGCPVKVTFQPASLASFLTFKDDKFIFSPNQQYHVGEFEITVFISDNQGLQTNATFWLTVFGPPKFIEPLPKKIDLMGSNPTNYTLPVLPEIVGQFVVHLTKLPGFIKFKFPTYQFFPSKVSDLGQYKIQGQLWNSNTYANYSFFLNVTNRPPIFLDQPVLEDLVVLINTTQKYQLPNTYDREGHSIRCKTYEVSSSSLPQFVRFNKSSLLYTITPTFLDAPKSYNIKIELSDMFDAVSSYTFKILVKDNSFSTESFSNKSIEAIYKSFQNSDKKKDLISFVNITLTKITRDQMAVISFYDSQKSIGIKEIIKKVSNNTFQAILKQNDFQSIVSFEIVSKEIEKSQIQIKLNYPDNSMISVQSKLDSLKIVNLNRQNILSQQKQLIFLENTQSENIIPPQLTLSIENKVAELLKGGRFTFTNITPINIFIGIIIQLIWSQLEDFSFLTILTLIAVPIPGLPSTIQKALIKLIYFDILYCELWLPQLMQKLGLDIEDNLENDDAISLQFDETGFSFKQFLKNAGSSLLYIFVYILAWISLLLIQRLSSLFPKLNTFKSKFEKQLMWGQSLSLLMSQFTPLFLCSIINFTYIRFQKSEKVIYTSAIISIAILASLGSALIAIFIKVYQLSKNLNEISIKEFNEKYSKLTEGITSPQNHVVYYWKPFQLLRWIFTLLILLFLNDQPAIQMVLLIFFSIFSQGLILKWTPYETPALNSLSFINELAVTLYLYVTLMLSDYMNSQLTSSTTIIQIRLILAWWIVILLLFIIFINFVYTYSGYAYSLFQLFKRRINQVRYKDRVIRLKPSEIQSTKPYQNKNTDDRSQKQKQIIDNEKLASSNQYQFTFEETSYIKKEKYNDSMRKIMPETTTVTNLNFERPPKQF